MGRSEGACMVGGVRGCIYTVSKGLSVETDEGEERDPLLIVTVLVVVLFVDFQVAFLHIHPVGVVFRLCLLRAFALTITFSITFFIIVLLVNDLCQGCKSLCWGAIVCTVVRNLSLARRILTQSGCLLCRLWLLPSTRADARRCFRLSSRSCRFRYHCCCSGSFSRSRWLSAG